MNINRAAERRKGLAALLAAAATYGSWGVMSRIIGPEIPLLYQNTFRSVLAVLIYAAVLKVKPGILLMKRRDFIWVVLRTVFGLTGIVTFVWGIRLVPFGTFYFMFYAGQAITGFFLGFILFGERITRIKAVSLLLALSGLALLYGYKPAPTTVSWLSVAIFCGISVSAWNTLSKKISGTYTPFELGFADNFWGIILGSAASFVLGERWTMPVPDAAWATNTVFGLTTVATGAFIVYGFKRMEAAVGSVVMLTEILFGIAFGFFLYGERLTQASIIGGLAVMIAVVLPELAAGQGDTIRSTKSI